jgi:ProP effector
MSKTARRARIAAVIELLCDRFPQTFSRRGPQPLKVGVYADVLAALGDGVQPRDLQSALRAYTRNARYLGTLSSGACRIDLDGKPAGTVMPEDEAVARARLAELAKGTAARATGPAAQAVAKASPIEPATENPKPPAPKRLSLADLREAGRRRREAAA